MCSLYSGFYKKGLRRMTSATMARPSNDFRILKSQDDLMIGGYASIEIVDKQNDLITLKALQDLSLIHI